MTATAGQRIVALSFLALGAALAISALLLPAGQGLLPGPGFFPGGIGLAMVLLSVALLFRPTREAPADDARMLRAVPLLALTFGYLLLWGTGLFAVRTFVFLLLFLKIAGQNWRAAAFVAAFLAAAVVLAFQYGLRVSLE